MASEMYSRTMRMKSFELPTHTSKKRTSSQTKKKTTIVPTWPHKTPQPIDLARAGFFFLPDDTEGDDNVKCFSCRACLNGWEPHDDPVKEHISHRPDCNWAIAISVTRNEESRDPLCDELLNARLATFEEEPAWPHGDQDGSSTCNIQRMAEAGFVFDAGPSGLDGATCHYCGLELNGWEPEDDPVQEHKKRRPDCRFFELLDHYHAVKSKVKAKAKTKVVKKVRGSAASKASRSSVQSTVSMAPSEMTDFENSLDDEIIFNGGNPQPAAKTKKASRATTRKASKSQKRTKTVDEEPSSDLEFDKEPIEATKPAKKPRKTTKKSTKLSMVEPTQDDEAEITTKQPSTEGRKKKTTTASVSSKRISDASSQLQEELDGSIIDGSVIRDRHPRIVLQKYSLGVKRASDGSVKDRDSSVMAVEFPLPPTSTSQKASEKVQKKKTTTFTEEATHDSEPPQKRLKSVPPPAVQESLRSITPEIHDTTLRDALLDDEERAIERQLAEIEAEQREREANVQHQSPPGRAVSQAKHFGAFEILQDEVNAEPYYAPMLPLTGMTGSTIKNTPTPSPTGSDKENNATSVPTAKSVAAAYVSPTKTMRIPLAPSTPNRTSPAKQIGTISPRKLIGTTRSTVPWIAVDLENVLLIAPQATPGKLRDQLVIAAGSLTAEERAMTVEEWIRSRAMRADEELKRKCEEMVSVFEREGNRALASLQGMHVMP